jgi:hypothetical protein
MPLASLIHVSVFFFFEIRMFVPKFDNLTEIVVDCF